MVRVAGLRGQARSEFNTLSQDGLSPGAAHPHQERVIELTDQQDAPMGELRRDIEEVASSSSSPRSLQGGSRVLEDHFPRAVFPFDSAGRRSGASLSFIPNSASRWRLS